MSSSTIQVYNANNTIYVLLGINGDAAHSKRITYIMKIGIHSVPLAPSLDVGYDKAGAGILSRSSSAC